MKFLATIAAALLMSSSAFASLYLEPYLGYESGKLEDSTGSDDFTATPIMGLKLGYGMLGFAGGVDYSFGTLKVDTTPSSETDVKDLGVFVGFTFPIMLKVSATYVLDAKGEANGTTSSGSGMKLGVGWTGLPFVAINFDMINYNYDEVEVGGATAAIDIDRKSYLLSVSLPLSF